MFQEKTFDTGQILINYAEGPDSGAPLVVLHGGTVCWQFMLPVLRLLAGRWHIFACDLRGHGRSGRAPGKYTLPDFSADVTALLRRIKEPAVLLGFSWGGLVALHTAGQTPLRALILESPPLDLHRRRLCDSPVSQYFRWVKQSVQSAPDAEALAAAVCRKGLGRDSQSCAAWAAAFQQLDLDFIDMLLDNRALDGIDFKQLLQAVSAPSLLLAGGQARSLSEEDIRFVRENLNGARIAEIEGAENAIHHSHPEQMAGQIEAFIQLLRYRNKK